MIPQYNDHAANERTYLAWLRTGIAVVAFGVVIERFDLFLRSITRALSREEGMGPLLPIASPYGRELGAVLVMAGLLLMATSTWRYWETARRIREAQPRPYDARHALLLGGVVVLLSLATLAYVLHTMSRS